MTIWGKIKELGRKEKGVVEGSGKKTAPKVLLGICQAAKTLLPVIMTCVFPILFLAAKNPMRIYANEALWFCAFYCAIGLLVLLIAWLITKNSLFASLLATVFMMLFLHFDLLYNVVNKLIPSASSVIAGILFLLIFAGMILLLIRIKKSSIVSSLLLILSVSLTVMTVCNCISWAVASAKEKNNWLKPTSVTAITEKDKNNWLKPTSVTAITETVDNEVEPDVQKQRLKSYGSFADLDLSTFVGQFSGGYRRPVLVSKEERDALAEAQTVKPNFYWIILDEASNMEIMQKFYDYDGNWFYDELKELGFGVSYHSQNRALLSDEVMSDLCTLEYNAVPEISVKLAQYYRYDGQLWYALHDLGYDIYQVSSEPSYIGVFYELSKYSDREVLFSNTTTIDGKTLLDLCIERTPLRVFNWKVLDFIANSKRLRVSRVFDFYADETNYTFGSSVALVSHISCPHSPFVFTAGGGEVERGSHSNWLDPIYYRQQWEYSTHQTVSTVQALIENDPNCIIIVQSDHGARPRNVLRTRTEGLSEEDMRQIINAVYVGGKPIDIEGLDGVNTLRLVLTEMGADYPQLTETPPIINWRY